jgi:hypothetical protein
LRLQASDLLVIMAYRSAWILADNFLGLTSAVNALVFAIAVPTIWWLRSTPDAADDELEDERYSYDGGAPNAPHPAQARAPPSETGPDEGARPVRRKVMRRRKQSIFND